MREASKILADGQQVGFTVKFTGSADDLVAAVQKTGQADRDTIGKLFNSSITAGYDRGGAGVADDRSQVAVTIDGVSGAEVRFVDKTVYLRVPVTDLATRLGGGDRVADARREVNREAPELGAFFDGQWISIDAAEAGKLAGRSSGLPTAQTDPQQVLAELQRSAGTMVEGADVVRDKDDDEHLVVTTSTTKAYAEVKRLVTAVVGEAGKGFGEGSADAPKDRPIVLDLWMDGDQLEAIEVNVLQFVDGAAGRAAVRLELTTGAAITAPVAATKIDPARLKELSSGLGARGFDTPGWDTTHGLGTPGSGTPGLGTPGLGTPGLGTPSSLDPSSDFGSASHGGPPGSAVRQADLYGKLAMVGGRANQEDPWPHLEHFIAGQVGMPNEAKIIRRGVLQVTIGKESACLRLPATYQGEPKVTAGACR